MRCFSTRHIDANPRFHFALYAVGVHLAIYQNQSSYLAGFQRKKRFLRRFLSYNKVDNHIRAPFSAGLSPTCDLAPSLLKVITLTCRPCIILIVSK